MVVVVNSTAAIIKRRTALTFGTLQDIFPATRKLHNLAMASPVPQRRKFAFDLRKPILKGTILKQGGLHRAFKQRFFILYPGFLVYYDDAQKWQYDLQRGETLGVRRERVLYIIAINYSCFIF